VVDGGWIDIRSYLEYGTAEACGKRCALSISRITRTCLDSNEAGSSTAVSDVPCLCQDACTRCLKIFVPRASGTSVRSTINAAVGLALAVRFPLEKGRSSLHIILLGNTRCKGDIHTTWKARHVVTSCHCCALSSLSMSTPCTKYTARKLASISYPQSKLLLKWLANLLARGRVPSGCTPLMAPMGFFASRRFRTIRAAYDSCIARLWDTGNGRLE